MDIAFNLTRKCNKSCDYCYLTLTDKDLPFEKLKVIMESTNSDTITLTGGEPLVHPNIIEILSYISEREKHIHLLTNGILLTDSILELIAKTKAELFVTFNEPDNYISSNLHLADAYGIVVNIHHVLTIRTIDFLDEICQDLYFARSIIFLYPTDAGLGNIKMYSPEEWFMLLSRAMLISERYGIKTYFEQAFIKKNTVLSISQHCPTGRDLFIDVDGFSYPCCLILDKVNGRENLIPQKLTYQECSFINYNPLPENSEFIRVCPIVVTDSFNGSFQFPSYLEEKK